MLYLAIIRLIICAITLIICINIVIVSKKINTAIVAIENSNDMNNKEDSCVSEFISNFDNVVDNFYKPIDRKKMLKRAFSSVLNELNDKYSKTLTQREIDSSYNYNFYIGYNFKVEKDFAVVTSINEPSILEFGLREHDKIISINGKSLARTK